MGVVRLRLQVNDCRLIPVGNAHDPFVDGIKMLFVVTEINRLLRVHKVAGVPTIGAVDELVAVIAMQSGLAFVLRYVREMKMPLGCALVSWVSSNSTSANRSLVNQRLVNSAEPTSKTDCRFVRKTVVGRAEAPSKLTSATSTT
jgi:hypothetical protein